MLVGCFRRPALALTPKMLTFTAADDSQARRINVQESCTVNSTPACTHVVFHSPRLLLVLPMPSLLLRAWAGLGLVATAAARPAKPNLVVFLQVRPTLSPRGGRAGQRPA